MTDQLTLVLNDDTPATELEEAPTAPVVALAGHRCPLCGHRDLEPLHTRHFRCRECGAGIRQTTPATGGPLQ